MFVFDVRVVSIYVESRRRSGARLQTLVRVVVCFGGRGRRWHKQEEEEGETDSAARVCEMGGLQ